MRFTRAQSTLEYAIILTLVIGALLFMSVYLRRGYQGKLKSSADEMGDQFDPSKTTTKEVNVSISHMQETVSSGVTQQVSLPVSQVNLDSQVTADVDISPYSGEGEVSIMKSEEKTEADLQK